MLFWYFQLVLAAKILHGSITWHDLQMSKISGGFRHNNIEGSHVSFVQFTDLWNVFNFSSYRINVGLYCFGNFVPSRYSPGKREKGQEMGRSIKARHCNKKRKKDVGRQLHAPTASLPSTPGKELSVPVVYQAEWVISVDLNNSWYVPTHFK